VTFANEGPYSVVMRARTSASVNLAHTLLTRDTAKLCGEKSGGTPSEAERRGAIAEWRESGEEGRGGTYCSAEAASLEGDGRRDSDSGGVPGIGCAERQRNAGAGAQRN
jgi:hypothetical protein